MSHYVPLEEPLVEEKVFKPYDTEADEYDAEIMAKWKSIVNKMPKTPPGKQGAAATSSTIVAMQGESDPEPVKSKSVLRFVCLDGPARIWRHDKC